MKINRRYRQAAQGFTLLEVMAIVAVLGILSAVGIASYSNYITKSKLVEAVVLFDAVRTSVVSDYYVTRGFPNSVMSARTSSDAGASQVTSSPNAITYNSNVISEVWYYQNEDAGVGWFGLQLQDDLLTDCIDDCRLHIGFKDAGSNLDFYCGLWDRGGSRG